jgi:uncharacterized membrane protein
MSYSTTFTVAAPAERVWPILFDVENWPRWTASITSVEHLDPTPLRVGSRVRIKQPRLASTVWTVTDIRPGHAFTWTSSAGGVTTTGQHVVEAAADHSATVTLGIQHAGMLAPLVNLAYGSLTRRYIEMEAAGLTREAEAPTLAAA